MPVQGRGRPKGHFAEFIQAETSWGEELAKKVLDLFRSSKDPKVILDAAEWLANRGFGRPVQSMEMSGPEGNGLILTIKDKPKE